MAEVIEVYDTSSVAVPSLIATVVSASTSGPPGPQGPPGINGADGTDGLDAANSLYLSSVSDFVLSTEVGGADAEPASVWKTRTIAQALDTILFPTVLPFVSQNKSGTLTVTGSSGVQEVGSTSTRTLTTSFNPGRITNGDGSLGPTLVGGANDFLFTGTGITGSTTNGSLGDLAVIFGTNQWSVSITHAAGTGSYFDNKGNASTALDGSRASGTVTAHTAVLTGVYPWFYLKSPVAFTATQFAAAITAGNATAIHPSAVLSKVVASASGTLSVPYNVSGQYLGVAYEQTNTTKTLYYVTALDNGSIAALFSPMASNPAVSTPLWTQGYKFHVSPNPLTNSNPTLELRNA